LKVVKKFRSLQNKDEKNREIEQRQKFLNCQNWVKKNPGKGKWSKIPKLAANQKWTKNPGNWKPTKIPKSSKMRKEKNAGNWKWTKIPKLPTNQKGKKKMREIESG